MERNESASLRFGVFLPPYHRSEQNPTLAIHRDLALIELWDRLGLDEVWVGEHHSGGVELIASPEQFLAAAAMRTRRIRLGTGVPGYDGQPPAISRAVDGKLRKPLGGAGGCAGRRQAALRD